AVVTHGQPRQIGAGLARLQSVAREHGVELLYPQDEAEKHGVEAGNDTGADIAVVLGGDGTVLRAITRYLGAGAPVVGCTSGRVRAPASASTAYNRSNGGPVLMWGLEAIALTYVAAHSLHARPLVIPPGADIIVWNRTVDIAAAVLVDGHRVSTLVSAARAVI